MAKNIILFAIWITIILQLSQQKPTQHSIRQSINETYSGCDQRMSRCYGMPSGCLSEHNCDVLLSATPNEFGAYFELFWNRDSLSSDRWVGAALSEDRNMGDDSVTECVLLENNAVDNRQGLTYEWGVRPAVHVEGISNQTSSFVDNVVSCSWHRLHYTSINTTANSMEFFIRDTKYYVFLAFGPTINDTITKHEQMWSSEENLYLGRPMSFDNYTTDSHLKPTTSKIMFTNV
jgi:hypothetical protein